MKPVIKFYLSGFGLADEIPVLISSDDLKLMLSEENLNEPKPGLLLEIAHHCIELAKQNRQELTRVLLKELKDSI